MKKILKSIIVILLFPLLLLFLIGILLYFPFDLLKYKKTLYYKDTKEKYTFLCGSTSYIRIYETIKKNSLPISFYRDTEVEATAYGYFVYMDILIVDLDDISVNEEKNAFTVEIEDIYTDISGEVQNSLKRINEILGNDNIKKAAVLIDAELLKEYPEIKYPQFDLIPVEDGNNLDALRTIISMHGE